jgi:hypothetical protein
LVDRASVAKRCDLDNATTPRPSQLSEADQAYADGFLENMLQIYPVLGLDVFAAASEIKSTAPELHLKGLHAKATGRDAPEGFVVAAGAKVRKNAVPSIHGYMDGIRQQLLADSLLVVCDADSYTRAEDAIFESPSTAAGVVLGRPANGRIEWKDAAGVTLKQIQEQAVAAP